MTLSYVDHNHIGVAGISRGADAALWAGANDSRVWPLPR
jgi:dipeptidyl aminopeptidase/acylaminoacyl peptidase